MCAVSSQYAWQESLDVQPPGPLPPSFENSRAFRTSFVLMSSCTSAKAMHSFTCARSSQYLWHAAFEPQLPSSGIGNVMVLSWALTPNAKKMRNAAAARALSMLFKRIFIPAKRIRLGQFFCGRLDGSRNLRANFGSRIDRLQLRLDKRQRPEP